MLMVNFKHRPLFIKHEYSSEYVIPYESLLIKYLYLGFQGAH